MPSAWAPTVGRLDLERAHRRLPLRRACPRGRGPGARRASPCRRAGSEPGIRQSSRKTSAVCEARSAVLLAASCPSRGPWCRAGRRTRPARASRSSGSTEAMTTCTFGDAAVGGVRLLAVEHPLVGRLVVAGAGAQRRDVGAGLGLGGAEGADLGVVRRRRSTAAPTRPAARACRSRRWRPPRASCP